MRKDTADERSDAAPPIPGQVLRHRTAIRRGTHSRPVSLALSHALIRPDLSFLDYGCGLGEDVNFLKAEGVQATGWDPYYQPDGRLKPADCVNLGYVLNVIEDKDERERTLKAAFDLAQTVLVVSVRIDQSLNAGTEFSDGLLTNSGSFQKIYSQSEFKQYLEAVLGRKPYMASLGIAYIFKDEAAEAACLVRFSIAPAKRERIDLLARFSADPEARALLGATQALGRLPLPSEFGHYDGLLQRFGSHARLAQLASRLLSPDQLAEARDTKKNDILTYFAMLQLRGLRPPRIRVLPAETQADIKLFWPSYKSAMLEGREFLFNIAKPELIRDACLCAPIGKRLPSDFYIHRSAEESLPALLRVVVFGARQIVGELDYDILKMAMDGRKLSFSKYKDFDGQAHPELLHSVRVHLPTASYVIRDYSSSENPPILHRKETMVGTEYPEHEVFAELTRQEEQRGLLSQPDIGFRKQWLNSLKEHRIQIIGHTICDAHELLTSPEDECG